MTGAPELRPGLPEGTVPGRSPGGKLARGGEKPEMPFDALLSGMGPKGGAGAAAAGDARPLGRLADIRGAMPTRLPGLAVEGAEAEPGIVSLDAASQGQTLAQGVAERIAAALAGRQAKDASAVSADDASSGRAEARRDGGLAASIAVAASLARRGDAAGAAAGRAAPPAVAVTHRETVFAVPATLGTGLQSLGTGTPGRPGSLIDQATRLQEGSRSASGSDADPVRQGRAEQLMLGDRAFAARGAVASAKAPDAAASTLPRAAEEAKAGGTPVSGEAATVATADEAPLGVLGAADQRTSGTPSPAAATAAQPAGAPPAFSIAPGPVKVLHIQLQPTELGTLEVRMRMVDGGLEIHIEASRPETVALLKSDRETLESVLRGAGHALDAVTVSLADKSGDASGQPPRDGWQGPASGARAEAQAGSAREQGGRSDDRSWSRPNGDANEKVHDDQSQSVAAVRPRGSVYL